MIGANGITLNCAGHTIYGSGSSNTGAGISLTGITKVTVKNCIVTGFGEFSPGAAAGFGFFLDSSSYNTLIGNTANNDGVGFLLSSSSYNALIGNTANSNTVYGFALDSSTSSSKVTGNTANSNTQYGYYDPSAGLGTKGTANFYSHDICRGNGVAGSSPSGLGTPQP